jgi:transposase InsO family protein
VLPVQPADHQEADFLRSAILACPPGFAVPHAPLPRSLASLTNRIGSIVFRARVWRIFPKRVRAENHIHAGQAVDVTQLLERVQSPRRIFMLCRRNPSTQHAAVFWHPAGSRYVNILGVTVNPDGPWTAQQFRNLLLDLGDRAADFRFLVRDRAGQFTASVDAVLADAGIEAVKIPPRSPRADAYAERFVLTARTDIADRMLIFGQRHLRTILAQYEAHYKGRRPHRSRQLRPPRPDHPVADLSHERIKRRSVLGGPINAYERAA